MKRANSFRFLVAGAVAVTVALVGTRVFADDAVDIESFYNPPGNNTYAQWDDNSGDFPIVTATASIPGTFGGHAYTGWSVLAEDSTGSMDLFTTANTLTSLTHNVSAVLNVGDKLNVAGQWSPFHQIPELAFTTIASSNNYINTVSTGNTPPAPPIFTISQLTANNTIPQNIAGYYLEVQGATISGSTGGFMSVFPNFAQANVASESYKITDGSGSMVFFDWVTSYSDAGAFGGTAVPTGPVNLYGFISYNTGGPLEFTALSIVPEPSTIALVGAGLFGLLAVRRRRS